MNTGLSRGNKHILHELDGFASDVPRLSNALALRTGPQDIIIAPNAKTLLGVCVKEREQWSDAATAAKVCWCAVSQGPSIYSWTPEHAWLNRPRDVAVANLTGAILSSRDPEIQSNTAWWCYK